MVRQGGRKSIEDVGIKTKVPLGVAIECVELAKSGPLHQWMSLPGNFGRAKKNLVRKKGRNNES
jgi:hypothetical protein